MSVNRPNSAELQFLIDDEDWYRCQLSDDLQTAKENLARIVQAEEWMHDHCEPNLAFRFGGAFYFKNQQDYLQFTLIWS